MLLSFLTTIFTSILTSILTPNLTSILTSFYNFLFLYYIYAREGALVARLVGVGAGGDGASGARAADDIAVAVERAADGDRAARATIAGADAVWGVAALGGGEGGHTVGDGDGAARAIAAAADASPIFDTSGVDGAASDADVAARGAFAAAADASPILATIGGDGAASDADGAARATTIAAADASRIFATSGGDGAAGNHDVATGDLKAGADAATHAVTSGRERAAALDSQGLVLRNIDAGIFI